MAVPVKLSLDALLQMSGSQVRETMKRLGSSSEECSRLTAALSCLKSATESGGELKEEGVPWITEAARRDSGTLAPADQLSCPGGTLRSHSPSPLARPHGAPPASSSSSAHLRSVSTSGVPSSSSSSDGPGPCVYGDGLSDPFPPSPRPGRVHGHVATPPATPPSKRRHRLKPPCTPPPPSRKVLHLLPNITLTRSKSHESQLGNRIEDPPLNKCAKKNKLFLNVHINGSGNGCEDSSTRSPLLSARTPGTAQTPSTAPYTLPGTPTLLEEHTGLRSEFSLTQNSLLLS